MVILMEQRFVNHFLCRIVLLTVLLSELSCNMNSYHDLGQPVNRFCQFGTDASSFLRTARVENETIIELFTISHAEEQYGSCAWLSVFVDSQAVRADLRTGTYERVKNCIVISYSMHYTNQSYEKPSPSKTFGAVQHQLSPKLTEEFIWQYDPYDGVLHLNSQSYKCIEFVYDKVLLKSSPNRMEQFIKLYLLCTMSAHCRIEGLGGMGMLQYVGKRTKFNGLLDGILELDIDGLNKLTSRFVYTDHSDVSGITLNGTMKNISDMSGDGTLDGVIDFYIQGTSNIWRGSVDYSKIEIHHTLPSKGYYILSIENDVCFVSYDYGNPGNFDFTDILDPDPACW